MQQLQEVGRETKVHEASVFMHLKFMRELAMKIASNFPSSFSLGVIFINRMPYSKSHSLVKLTPKKKKTRAIFSSLRLQTLITSPYLILSYHLFRGYQPGWQTTAELRTALLAA